MPGASEGGVVLRDGLRSPIVGPYAALIRDAKGWFLAGSPPQTTATVQRLAELLERVPSTDSDARDDLADAAANLRRIAVRLTSGEPPVEEAELDGALWCAYVADLRHLRTGAERQGLIGRAAELLEDAADAGPLERDALEAEARGILVSLAAGTSSSLRGRLLRQLERLEEARSPSALRAAATALGSRRGRDEAVDPSGRPRSEARLSSP